MVTSPYLPLLIVFGFGYLLGSIPFGLLLTRAAGLGDVRSIGSGNIGATNVLRTGNKKLAALTLFLDGFKGYAAVMAAWLVIAPMLLPTQPPGSGNLDAAITYLASAYRLAMSAGLGALLGHVYPVWLGFKGGKGVATYIGVLLALAWKIGLMFCGIWLLVALALRYSSVASLTALAAAPVLIYWLGSLHLAFLFLLMSALLIWKHRENIRRLLDGTESKIGAKSAKSETT